MHINHLFAINILFHSPAWWNAIVQYNTDLMNLGDVQMDMQIPLHSHSAQFLEPKEIISLMDF